MAEKTEFLQAIDDAILDADSLERFINGSDSETVLTRLSAEYPTLQKAIKELFENGGLPATPFKTKSLMQASSLTDGSYAIVTDDGVAGNNGLYVKDNGVWVVSKYSPISKDASIDSVLDYSFEKVNSYKFEDLSIKGQTILGVADPMYNSERLSVTEGSILKLTAGASVGSYFFQWVTRGGVKKAVTIPEFNTGLDKPIDGYRTFYLNVPKGAGYLLVMSFSEQSPKYVEGEFNLTEYRKADPVDKTIEYDWARFLNDSTNSILSTYNKIYIPLISGQVVYTEGLIVKNDSIIKFLDENNNILSETAVNSTYFKAPEGTVAAEVQCVNETHELWEDSIKDNFKLTVYSLHDSNNLVDKSFYNLLDGAKNGTNYISIDNIPVHSSSLAYLDSDVSGGIYASLYNSIGVRIESIIDGESRVGRIINIADVDYMWVQTKSENHVSFNNKFKPFLFLSNSMSDIFSKIKAEGSDFINPKFTVVGHPDSGTQTYNSTDWIYIPKGALVEYNVNALSSYGAFIEVFDDGSEGDKLSLTNSKSFIAPANGKVALGTFNETHSSYNPDFTPSVRIVYDPSRVSSSVASGDYKIAGAYPDSLYLKTTRDVTFKDGTDRLTIEYLWYDDDENFFISSTKDGAREFAFKYNRADFYNEPPEHISIGIDFYGNIVCVPKIEQIPPSLRSDNNRRNPIILVRDKGFKPAIVDFGERLKPSGWLQNGGFIATEYGIHIVEYTRPSVETANSWKATYPLTDSSKWVNTQSFPLTEDKEETTTLKHMHSVNRDPYTGVLYTTTGDYDAGAWMFASTDNGDTYTKILDGSEKYCRVLNFIFLEDYIYWATDSRGAKHWIFRAPRDSNGILDVNNIEDLHLFPSGSMPTYATIYFKSEQALLFLGRKDSGTSTELPVDVWDLKTNTFHTPVILKTALPEAVAFGFRTECFEFYPRSSETIAGFSRGLRLDGLTYSNGIAILGNSTDSFVNNIAIGLHRVGDEFEITFRTVF